MPIHVSASALKDYVICSQKIYYRIFETGEAIPTREMLMGTITHKVIEKAWQNIDVALNLGKSLCIKNNLDIVAQQSVEHFIHIFFESFSPFIKDDDKIEKRFKIKLYDDVFLVGVFDRISSDIVIDWKTNANPPKKIDGDIQFIIYDMAYNIIYGKKAGGLYLAALKDGSMVRYNESKAHSDALINMVIPEFVETVRKKSFERTGLFNGACYRCPYKLQCLGGEKDVLVRGNDT